MITEQEIEKACDWLRDHAEEAAQAKAARVYLEHGRKRLLALIMKEHVEKPIGAQEREARADERYEKHLEGLREAVYADEKCKFLRSAAEAKIEAWRTEQANARGLGKVG